MYENDVLVPKPVGGGVLKSESSQNTPTSDLKHQYIACQSPFKTPEKLSKTWTDQIEGSNAPDDSVSERIEKIDGDDSFVLGKSYSAAVWLYGESRALTIIRAGKNCVHIAEKIY